MTVADQLTTITPAADAAVAVQATHLRLATLLREVATTSVCDPAWERLGREARSVTVAMTGAGALPAHLVVGPHDRPALVTRTLAAAWRHATPPPRP